MRHFERSRPEAVSGYNMYCVYCGKTIPDGSAFCPQCGRSTTSAPSQVKAANRNLLARLEALWKILGALVIIFGALFFFAYIYLQSTHNVNKNRPDLANPINAILPTHQPVTEKIFQGEMVVKAGQYRFWSLPIPQEMANAQLLGSFHASGGSGNDIQAVVAEPREFENWINGHEARVYYSTGKITNGRIELRLARGTYIIAFSNKFSPVTDKELTADLELHYLK